MPGTIICYGDSNTYGYDPRSFLGGRYTEEKRWPDILAARTGWDVINCGKNGRCTPYFLPEIESVLNCLERWSAGSPPVWLWIMLGTNDLLHNPKFTAKTVTDRMERFLRKLMECEEIVSGKIRLRLISPVHLRRGVWVETDERCRESEKMDVYYQELAAEMGIAFSRAGKWDIPVLFDGVHFSEEGNLKFAECMIREMRDEMDGRRDK
ncbi:MAG: GDSL-type esterase/lipase family protein [Clostridiales bacterium]|nr:GDSL-type esterase/lipase family protein [Clostridiales bacterium]